MYTPPHYKEERPEALQAFIHQHSFGLLISPGPQGMEATHLPFLLEVDGAGPGRLLAHLSRANPQWKHLEEAGEVLTVFSGPHAYISASWYTERTDVPTWNYVAVHAYGRARRVDGERLHGMLARMAQRYEATSAVPWSLGEVPEASLQAMTKGIVGIEIELTRLQGTRKLSQNRSAEDQQRVLQALRERGSPDDLALAALMERPS
ncbi:FMN-binding negative transcriptional regulator [Stigmatella sp. ncwal1]|uniref:FMN-binding negative transcriptional regulator n=1 Tax=Stigmatella ashevillensis TaxID=2995309 RepID=A0ABT5D998_9BACT|nr:FMN-binding negative transcriptional regulator [Stigmatella ashevillena]MDC0710224.1 FMN-binding negative transcriptional regulator [Stigmatella ashevillena]